MKPTHEIILWIMASCVVNTAIVVGMQYAHYQHAMQAMDTEYANKEQAKEDAAHTAFLAKLLTDIPKIMNGSLSDDESAELRNLSVKYGVSTSHIARPDDSPYDAGTNNPIMSNLADLNDSADYILGRMNNAPINCLHQHHNKYCQTFVETSAYFEANRRD